MYVVFRDEIGFATVTINGPVSFLDGKAYFTIDWILDDTKGYTEGQDMIIPVEHIVEIGKEK